MKKLVGGRFASRYRVEKSCAGTDRQELRVKGIKSPLLGRILWLSPDKLDELAQERKMEEFLYPRDGQERKSKRPRVAMSAQAAGREISIPKEFMFQMLVSAVLCCHRLTSSRLCQPNRDPSQHDVIYVCGKGGSGKSLLAKNYTVLWKKLNPDNADRVYVVCALLLT